ncbi:hypothetical protein T10_11893 [Trichinella papuae]|uniref:Uncharacterized protein n=1 Tax=Trichinella papuae TaxID=268474 RepID=A0A0V1M3Y0_9BILA|nr:hypothetical protein T10_11893 [Trichinella papuae]
MFVHPHPYALIAVTIDASDTAAIVHRRLRVHCLTDRIPLAFTFARASDSWTFRQQRHLAYISGFAPDVPHVS